MDDLRSNVQLARFEQKDPLLIYKFDRTNCLSHGSAYERRSCFVLVALHHPNWPAGSTSAASTPASPGNAQQDQPVKRGGSEHSGTGHVGIEATRNNSGGRWSSHAAASEKSGADSNRKKGIAQRALSMRFGEEIQKVPRLNTAVHQCIRIGAWHAKPAFSSRICANRAQVLGV